MKKFSTYFDCSILAILFTCFVIVACDYDNEDFIDEMRLGDKEDSTSDNKTLSSQETLDILTTNGLTCEIQKDILEFSDNQSSEFLKKLHEEILPEDIAIIVENREMGCLMSKVDPSEDKIIPMSAPGYNVEEIEETYTNDGYYPYVIWRDGSSFTGDMCGLWWEYPQDYVLGYYVPNALANKSRLKISGTNWAGRCYIANPTMARVYTNDMIQACVGYWSVYFCTATGVPTTYESRIQIQ